MAKRRILLDEMLNRLENDQSGEVSNTGFDDEDDFVAAEVDFDEELDTNFFDFVDSGDGNRQSVQRPEMRADPGRVNQRYTRRWIELFSGNRRAENGIAI